MPNNNSNNNSDNNQRSLAATTLEQSTTIQQQQQQESTRFKLGESAVTNQYPQLTDPYSAYADSFDLSLLPQIGGVTLNTPTTTLTPSTVNIPTTVYQYNSEKSLQTTATPETTTAAIISEASTPISPITPPEIKIEQSWSCLADDIKQEQTYSLLYDQLNCQPTKSTNKLIPPPPPAYPHIYPSPQSSPAQSEYAFASGAAFNGSFDSLSSSRTTLYALSPYPSFDAGSIKQELHILPPSPPESNCEAPSPHSACSDIKSEPLDSDVENLIDLNTLLEKTFSSQESSIATQQQQQQQHQEQEQQQQQHQDHQLLREYLEDTTFQKKHNLKPLALESFIGGLAEVRGDIEPVISLALEHVKREADAVCAELQISQDPCAWSPVQVHAWLRSTLAQFKLPQTENLELKFCENGATLILLTEEEFIRRLPESGSTLHAQLEIWKMAYADGYQNNSNAAGMQFHSNSIADNGNTQVQPPMWQMNCMQTLNMDYDDDSEDEDQVMAPPPLVVTSTTTTTVAAVAAAVTNANSSKRVGGTGGRSGGSHIHLWQFLKELLSAPHVNGTAIRWIDRSKGIFKIEDSVRVAKLWGRRKNRPAMNYDKLSRSIRQYYKKGIMKKTERSQRLVYQFCHPYHQ